MPLEDEIKQESERIYISRYGRKNPKELSTLENEAVIHEAGKRVQERRRKGGKGK